MTSTWVTAEWMGWISGFGHILPAWAQSRASWPWELSCPAQGIRWPRLWGILSGTGTSRPSTISWASSGLPTPQTWAWPQSQATTSSVKPFRWVRRLWPWTIQRTEPWSQIKACPGRVGGGGGPSSLLGRLLCSKQVCFMFYLCGTSLVIQWLRLGLPKQEVWVWSLVGELRYHMPPSQKTTT